MAPRADFACRNCGKSEGAGDAVHTDLPVACTRCPVCGFKRGFRRLFNAVNVSTTGHRVAQVLDPMMRPQFEQLDATRAKTTESEKRLVEAHEQGIAAAPEAVRPALREAMAQGPVRFQGNAQAALNGIPGAARLDSRNHLFPHIRRRVVPAPA